MDEELMDEIEQVLKRAHLASKQVKVIDILGVAENVDTRFAAIDRLMEEGFIKGSVPYPINLTSKGYDAVDAGGYQKYKEKQKEKERLNEQQQRENIARNKLARKFLWWNFILALITVVANLAMNWDKIVCWFSGCYSNVNFSLHIVISAVFINLH